MRMKFPLLALSMIFLMIGGFSYFSGPPSTDAVFNNNNTINTNGHTYIYSTPRGAPRIMIIGENKNIYYIDCLVNPYFCSRDSSSKDFIEAELALINNKFYWPKHAKFRSGFYLSKEQSIMIYEIYSDKERSMHSFWFWIAMAFLVFSVWFGNRPLLDS